MSTSTARGDYAYQVVSRHADGGLGHLLNPFRQMEGREVHELVFTHVHPKVCHQLDQGRSQADLRLYIAGTDCI
jgi:hypothetical protein